MVLAHPELFGTAEVDDPKGDKWFRQIEWAWYMVTTRYDGCTGESFVLVTNLMCLLFKLSSSKACKGH